VCASEPLRELVICADPESDISHAVVDPPSRSAKPLTPSLATSRRRLRAAPSNMRHVFKRGQRRSSTGRVLYPIQETGYAG